MRTPSTFVVVLATVLLLCGFALLFAQGRILPHTFVDTPVEKRLADGCYLVSTPGLIVALALHPGYWTKGTAVSDLIIVTVNTAIYGVPAALLLRWLMRRRDRKSSRLA